MSTVITEQVKMDMDGVFTIILAENLVTIFNKWIQLWEKCRVVEEDTLRSAKNLRKIGPLNSEISRHCPIDPSIPRMQWRSEG